MDRWVGSRNGRVRQGRRGETGTAGGPGSALGRIDRRVIVLPTRLRVGIGAQVLVQLECRGVVLLGGLHRGALVAHAFLGCRAAHLATRRGALGAEFLAGADVVGAAAGGRAGAFAAGRLTFSKKLILNPTSALRTKLDSLLSLGSPTNLDFDSFLLF